MRILWQLWHSTHIWISITILWLFLILLYRRPRGLIFQQMHAIQRIEMQQRQRKAEEQPMGMTIAEQSYPTPEPSKEAAFAYLLLQATGHLFTPEQSATLLTIYERRNGLFDATRQPCPECHGLAHSPAIINQVHPACLACHGIGFLDLEPPETEQH